MPSKNTKLTTTRAIALRNALLEKHKKHLEKHGVKYPMNGSLEPALLALFEQNGAGLTHDEMAVFHSENATGRYNRQIRHLSEKGWDIRSGSSRFARGEVDDTIGRDEYSLHSTTSPNPVFLNNSKLKRVGRLTDLEWIEKLAIWKEHGCSVCGRQCKTYEQGHLDSNRAHIANNIVPMCVQCNNWGQAHGVDFEQDDSDPLVVRPVMPKRK